MRSDTLERARAVTLRALYLCTINVVPSGALESASLIHLFKSASSSPREAKVCTKGGKQRQKSELNIPTTFISAHSRLFHIHTSESDILDSMYA